MNERIRELAEQAGFQSYITTHEEDVAMFEKFAELIAKDCIDICTETQSEYHKLRIGSDDFTDKLLYCEGETSADRIKYKLKKHFGVSE